MMPHARRVRLNLLDPEVGFLYAGTYLGRKRVLAVATAFDKQQDYHAYDADAFLDGPLVLGAVTAQVDYKYTGDSLVTAEQHEFTLQLQLF